ncbi:uncharacterized protein LOC135087314 [Ostrinia nubilalis]|uniref:uncharacterized protein LOC135087314 n=1 Tax=Ostrinia nubilalis TaxID=29057 RepID=UPI0030825965
MALNSTFNQGDLSIQECKTGEMSVDGSLIDKESPPNFVTHRKGTSTEIQELRSELKAFQTSIVSTLESWFTRQDENFSKLIDDMNEMKTSIQFIRDKYEDLNTKTEDIARRVTILESTTAQANSSSIAHLEAKIDIMEQQARQCNLEITNIPEKRGENLASMLEDIATLVKETIHKHDIVAIHRVPHASPASQRPKNIIVKFTSRLKRDSLISAVRLHKGITTEQLNISGPPHKVFINEHLTLRNKNLFRQAREAAKQHSFRFVWVKHGSILVRRSETSPIFSIRCESDLVKITSTAK